MTIDFCLPVRNEESILEANLIKLRDFLILQNYSFTWQIVVILNNCDDNSEPIVNQLVSLYPTEFKYLSVDPPGKGGALKKYFTISQADVLVFMDIDLAVSLENLSDLINPIINDNYDLVIGSRLLKNSKVERSFLRSFSSVAYNFLSRQFLNHKFYDLQCGFKAFKREVFIKIEPYLNDNQWFLDTELVILANFFKFRIKEIPVNWAENRYAQRTSKINIYQQASIFIKNLFFLRGRINKLKRAKKYPDNV
ncbi:MAG: glycosyltransferase [Patescibacteria group bacterium]